VTNRDDRYWFQYDFDVLTALGRMTMNASYVEEIVRVMLWRLLGSGKGTAERLTADANFRWLFEHCRALAEYQLNDQLRVEVHAWLVRVNAAYEKRNKIVHSSWYVDVTDPKTLRLGYTRSSVHKKSLERTRELATADAMHEVARELERVGLEGVQLMGPIIEKFGQLVEQRWPPGDG
jgi:hypothetical protein